MSTVSRRSVWGLLAASVLAAGLQAADLRGLVSVKTAVMRETRRRGSDAYGSRSTPNPGRSDDRRPPAEVQNVVVFLKEAVTGDFSPPSEHPVIIQKDASFEPRVLPVLQGTTVDFTNQDSIYHNVFSLSRAASFDLGRYPRPQTRSRTFHTPGLVRVNCHIHAHMLAHVLVLPHPYFAVPDRQGHFVIRGVPPGSYHLVAWHDTLPPLVRSIRVVDGGTLQADFEF